MKNKSIVEPYIFFPKFQFSLHSWASLVDQFTFSTSFFEFFFHQQFTNFQIILFSDESMDILKTFNYTAQHCGDPLPMAQQN